MAVRILVRRERLVMTQMIAVVDARDRAERAEDADVVEQVVALAIREEPAMQPVVADDEERVVARADDGEREARPPTSASTSRRRPTRR